MERSGNFYKAIQLGYILISILIGCMAYNSLAIIVYYSVSTLDELKEFRNQYSDDYIFISELMSDYSPFKIKYGVQSTPTCFVIDRSGTVVLKTIGFNASQVKTTIN